MNCKLLKVNLSSESFCIEDVDELEKNYLGGLGVNTALVLEHIAEGIDPLSAENVLIFGAGSLVGALLPTACRTEVTAKSPLSGRFGSSNAGGEFGVRLKMAGFSYLMFEGKAASPVLLVISNGNVQIESAAALWGMDSWTTVNMLKERYGKEVQVASIGPAGENGVRFASIQNNYYAAWGRTGLGAVMGSKNLKAIVVNGKNAVAVANRTEFNKVMREGFERVKHDNSFGPIGRFGSMLVSDPFNKLGGLPGRNFTRGFFPEWGNQLGRKYFEKNYKVKDLACFACPIACCHWSIVREGPFAGYETKGLEVTFVTDWGAKAGLTDIAEILKTVELCNRLGMDIVSASGIISFVLEAAEKDKIDLDISWGDAQKVWSLLNSIAAREGLGEILAGGTRAAGEHLRLEEFAMEVKGLEIPHRDPRAKWDVWTLGYLTNTRGGDSLRTRSPVEAVMGKVLSYDDEALEVTWEEIAKLDMPQKLKEVIFEEPPQKVDIARMARFAEDLITIINSVGMCIRPPILRALGPDFFARALSAVTGNSYHEEEVLKIAGRIYDMQHQFNVKEGENISEYHFPERFYLEPLQGEKGIIPPLDKNEVKRLVEKYFKVRNWDY